jgi:AcrR family transcriptional regulator
VAKYELKARAERMAETRQRIVEATIGLHSTIGPARTSIMAIAEAAGVQRHTVYSHFPDEKALFAACSGLYYERNPRPPTEPWRLIDDPVDRVRRALTDTYGYYHAHERELWPIVRDAPFFPDITEKRLKAARDVATAAITSGWHLRGKRAARTCAFVDLAVRFETWRSLTRDSGLSQADAVTAMADAVLCAAGKA